MAINEYNISVETRLTKNDKAPPSVNGDISEMTGSSRESKAQRYADKAVKEVASQYTATIYNMQNDIAGKDDTIAELQKQLNELKSLASTNNPSNNPPIPIDISTNTTTENNIDPPSAYLHIEIDDDDTPRDNPTNHKDSTTEEEENISLSSNDHDPNKDEDLSYQSESPDNEDRNNISSFLRGYKRTGEEVKSSLYRATRARKNNDTTGPTSIHEVDPDL